MPMLRYAITDRALFAGSEPDRRFGLVAQAARLAADGVEFIQLREKDLPAQDLIGLARKILNEIAASHSGTRLLINARADVALAAGAHGVHLPSGEDQLTPMQVRNLLGRHAHLDRHSERSEESPHSVSPGYISTIVSVSCHTIEDVKRAKRDGADMLLFGPVFGKWSGSEMVVPGTGLEALGAACDTAGETPVFALGGITAEGAATTIAAGARGIAAIRLFR